MGLFEATHAIALEHNRIALFRNAGDEPWSVIDEIDISGLSQDHIYTTFASRAQKWRELSPRINAWLPADVVEVQAFESRPTIQDIRMSSDGVVKYPEDNFTIFVTKTAPFLAYIFETDHIDVTVKFFQDFHFVVSKIGISDLGAIATQPVQFSLSFDQAHHETVEKSWVEPEAEQLELNFDDDEIVPKLKDTKKKSEHYSNLRPHISERAAPREVKAPSVWPQKLAPVAILALLASVVGLGFLENNPSSGKIDGTQSASVIVAPQTVPEKLHPNILTQPLPKPIPKPVLETFPAPDFEIVERPSDQESIAVHSEAAHAQFLTEALSFAAVDRPETHKLDIADLMLKPAGEISPSLSPTTNDTTISQTLDGLAENNGNTHETDLALIGISGASENPGALIRSTDGSFHQVKVGDDIDGWLIEAISRKEVIVKNGDSKQRLTVPNG